MSTNRQDVVRVLPDYELGDQLGRGEFGIVWRGRHRQLDRDVAIKQLAGPETVVHAARFRREARVLAQMDHPHVVTVYDYREDGELRLLVMEYLPGGTLADRRAAGMNLESAIAATLAAALGTPLRARARHPAPRRQAREPDVRRAGHAEGHRLRHRSR